MNGVHCIKNQSRYMWFYISFIISGSGEIICLTERLMGPGGTGWNCLLSSWQKRVSNKEKEGQGMGRGRLGKQTWLEWGWELPIWHWNRQRTESQDSLTAETLLHTPPTSCSRAFLCVAASLLWNPFIDTSGCIPMPGLKMDRQVGCRERGATFGYFF